MKVIRFLGTILFFATASGCFAQADCNAINKRFSVWKKQGQGKFSEKGDWFTYIKSGAQDSLFVVNTRNGIEKVFTGVSSFNFLDAHLLAVKKEGADILFDLKRDHSKRFDPKEYAVWHGNEGLLWKKAGEIGYTSINGKNRKPIRQVAFFQLHTSQNWGIYTTEVADSTAVYTLNIGDWKQQQLLRFSGKLKRVVYNPDDNFFVIAVEKADGSTQLFAQNVTVKQSMDKIKTVFVKDIAVNSISLDSRNGKVYFNTLSVPQVATGKAVSFAESLKAESTVPQNKRMVWNTLKEEVYALAEPGFSEMVPTAHPDRYIGIKTDQYDPRDHNGLSYADYYISGKGIDEVLIERKMPLLYRQLLVAPHAEYLAYFKEGNWWSYNIGTMEKRCLTCKVAAEFENTLPNYPYSVRHYETMGWSADGRDLLIYSKYDIWRLALDGSSAEVLTAGITTQTVFRHAVEKTLPKSFISDPRFETKIIPSGNKFVLTAYRHTVEEQALYLLNCKRLFEICGFANQQFDYTKLTEKYLVYKAESFNKFPYFVRHDLKTGKTWSSDKQSDTVNFGKTKVITLEGTANRIKGALLYPTDYKPGAKYPLIVSLYEREAQEINKFRLPTLENHAGFNAALYTQNGYFVLYPDLRYTHDNVLESFQTDLDGLLDKVIAEEPAVNADKLGVIGHSFGGFQVMHAVGHTHRFKAAVAGAGVSDLMDFYFTEHGKGGVGMFAFEFAQYRSKMPVGNSNIMLNDPLSFAHKITTPLFLWSGTSDSQVHHRNSEKMYKALWRQKKEAYLTLYDKESHALEKKENQTDLSCRILKFFDAKLK
ncbi:MAG: prolyl oligopeptidase family serine peptidase [Pedobacter sp.]|uniref:alpha/beta hydrolase family protein n=1 Tax=Pedobacter sp. TaxID=1411316 RepID=UPI0035689617